MKLDQLLSRLEKHKITLAEDKHLPDGTRVLTFVTHLPTYPFGEGRHTWYSLPLSPGQQEVSKKEVDALLRHLWHGELDFFEDENPFENS
jgi:hypothetical protein